MSKAEEWLKKLIREKYNIPEDAEIDISGLHFRAIKDEPPVLPGQPLPPPAPAPGQPAGAQQPQGGQRQ